jgi:hypothetical protein
LNEEKNFKLKNFLKKNLEKLKNMFICNEERRKKFLKNKQVIILIFFFSLKKKKII